MLASKNLERWNDQERKEFTLSSSYGITMDAINQFLFIRFTGVQNMTNHSESARITKVGFMSSVPREVICHLNATVHQATKKTAAT